MCDSTVDEAEISLHVAGCWLDFIVVVCSEQIAMNATLSSCNLWTNSCKRGASGATDADREHGSRGNLSVAGLPLLDEDVDVIAHVRKIL